MSASTFAQSIIGKLSASIGTDGSAFTTGSAGTAMTAVASAITEYLIANTTVLVAYVGTMTTGLPNPDPIVTDTFKIIGSCAPPGPSNNFDEWIKQLEGNIIAGFQLAPTGNSGVVFPQKPFLTPGILTTQSQLKGAHDVNDTSPQQQIWEIVCNGIMNWINTTALNATPGGATRPSGPSAGVATITKITVS